jgi:chromosomal replication initiator protein
MSDLWSSVLNDIRSQVRSEAYNTWFRPLDCDEVENDRVVLSVPDDFYLSWFQDNYVGLLTDTLSQHLGMIPQVEFLQRQDDVMPVHLPTNNVDSGLNPKYRFDTFVVGDSNKFPNAASIGVAQNPGDSYNPLFIYGKVGLGKTHLLHAIGNAVLENNPNARVKYVTCETFVNDVVQMLARGWNVDGFRSMYCDSVDVLLVDDI